MGIEIERKFLLASDGWRRDILRTEHLVQGYVTKSHRNTVRIRIVDGARAWLTIKLAGSKLRRPEFEYEVPLADGEALLAACGDRVIHKLRHTVMHEGMAWSIDEFAGRHRGLVIAELELEREDQPFSRPSWLGEEVSERAEYYNSVLAGADA